MSIYCFAGGRPPHVLGRTGFRSHFAAGEIPEIAFAPPYLLNELITLTDWP